VSIKATTYAPSRLRRLSSDERRPRVVQLAVLAFVVLVLSAPAHLRAEIDNGQLPVDPPPRAASNEPPAPRARSAIVVESETGTVLYEHGADERIPPASLTKIVTLHLLLDELETGALSPGEAIETPAEAAWNLMPAGSSLLFISPGMEVAVDDLLYGLAIASGNDAATAVAIELAGGVPEFAQRMNEHAASLGTEVTEFVDPSGISAENRSTARELARIGMQYLEEHGAEIERLHAAREFEFPSRRISGDTPSRVFPNRNVLLELMDDADGLKTGYIGASGYNLMATAEREDMRLLAVVLGVDADNHQEGGRKRAEYARDLLEWAYDSYTLVRPSAPELPDAQVWGGATREVPLVPARSSVPLVLPVEAVAELRSEVEVTHSLRAPVDRGVPAGRLRLLISDDPVAAVDILPGADVPTGAGARARLERAYLGITDFFSELMLR